MKKDYQKTKSRLRQAKQYLHEIKSKGYYFKRKPLDCGVTNCHLCRGEPAFSTIRKFQAASEEIKEYQEI